jgi:small subunit ribosomal protein S21
MSVRIGLYPQERIGAALRRFKRLLERSGVKKEIRKHEYYVKPCDLRRRAALRRLRAIYRGATSHGSRTGWGSPGGGQ